MATVTVACKLPRGIVMRGGSMQDMQVPVFGGGQKTEKRWQPDGRMIVIRGPKRGINSDDPASPNSDGFALTFNVDKDIAEQWFRDNKDAAMVKNGMVLMHGDRASIKSMTRERRDALTGMEPLNPNGDPRVPRSRVTMEDDRPQGQSNLVHA